MGLFRKSAKAPDPPVAVRPIPPIEERDIDDADALLEAVEQGFAQATPADTSAAFAAVERLSRRAGSLSGEQLMHLPREQMQSEATRLFDWLLAVSVAAEEGSVGISTVPLRVFCFLSTMVDTVMSNTDLGLQMEMRLYTRPDAATLADAATVAIVSSRFMDDAHPMFALRQGVITAGSLRRLAAARLGGALDAPLPADVGATMETFGRRAFYGERSETSVCDLDLSIAAPVLALDDPAARADAAGRLVDKLADALVPAGGWSAYGAYRFLADVLRSPFERPSDRALLQAGLEFMHDNGVPPMHVSRFELDEWRRIRGEDARWLAGRALPGRDDVALTDLADGEERHVYDAPRKDGLVNSIYAYRDEAGEHFALIRYEDPGTEPYRDWQRAPTLYDLYVRLGEAAQVPQQAMAAEFEPFVPLPAPQIPLP